MPEHPSAAPAAMSMSETLDPSAGRRAPVQVGLLFGPKARLVLMHINQQALLSHPL